VRLVTATHRDLDALVQQGRFRQDLYWRIAHTCIEMPPLRERVMDVVPIADHVLTGVGAPSLAILSASHSRVAWQVAEIVERYLLYDWPGNVRELRDEAGRLAEAMRHRQRMQASSPVPPLDEACSSRLRGQPLPAQPSAPSAVASRVESAPPPDIDPQEAAWFAAVLDDRESLSDAIRSRAGGRIRAFAEQASRALGRPGDGVRRHIYRTLGDSLDQLREPRTRLSAAADARSTD
jgi:transcriptional regulator with GAF, ATPase, and Fis domain